MIPVVDRVPTYPNRIKITTSDGVSEYVTWERADEPTVEGTPINKALFDSIAMDIGLTADQTVFVTTAGSDTLGDGTNANPYATIGKAVSTLPKNLNGKQMLINVAAGTYNETVRLTDYTSGVIRIHGVQGAGVTITGLSIENSLVLIDAINLNVGGGGIFVGSLGMLYCASGNISVNGASGTKLYVNEREMKLTGADLLNYIRSLKAEDIAKIEIVPQTGADHDADADQEQVKPEGLKHERNLR